MIQKLTILRKLNFNTAAAVFLIFFSVIMLFAVPDQVSKSKIFMGRSLTALDPKLFPYFILAAMLLFSMVYLLKSFSLEEKNLFKELPAISIARVGLSLLIFLAYAILMEPMGFIPASVVLFLVLTTIYGNRNWLLGISVSVLFPVIIYVLFIQAFQVYLPESTLW
jgi:putative tricarboxylic transport membrane protein